MGMNLERWVKRDDLKDALRATLATPEMVAALEVIDRMGRPSLNIKGQAEDHLHNLALYHAFQSGINFALDKLQDLPNMIAIEKTEVENSWGRFDRSKEDLKKEDNLK